MSNTPFVIKRMNLFSSWVFNLPKNTECTICRCSLNGPSLYHQEKGIDSYVVSGICQHSFHNECIKPWVDKNKLCPICTQTWEFSKTNISSKYDLSDDDDLPNLISLNKKIKKYDIVETKHIFNDFKEKIDENLGKNKDDILKLASEMITDLKNNLIDSSNNEIYKVTAKKISIDSSKNEIKNTGNDITDSKMQQIKQYIKETINVKNKEDKKINIILKASVKDKSNINDELNAVEPPKTPEPPKKVGIKTMNNTEKMICIFKDVDDSNSKFNLYKSKIKDLMIDDKDFMSDDNDISNDHSFDKDNNSDNDNHSID
jgi:anaphase-promoting complex subunit 11